MTIETINVKGNASKALEEHHNRLKTEAKELIKADIKPPATKPFMPTGRRVLTSIGNARSAFAT